jgi:hypothetical protein
MKIKKARFETGVIFKNLFVMIADIQGDNFFVVDYEFNRDSVFVIYRHARQPFWLPLQLMQPQRIVIRIRFEQRYRVPVLII